MKQLFWPFEPSICMTAIRAPGRELEVEVRSAVTHTITLKKVQDWLNGGTKSPKEAVLKERLRSLL